MNYENISYRGLGGLIGSHLCDELISLGHDVIAVDNLSFGNKENCGFTIYERDLTKVHSMKEFFWESVDVVYHLAKYKKAPKNSISSADVMKVNFKMMENVLDFCERTSAKLIFTSTSDIYGNSETFDESDPITIGPPNVERYSYALSKLHDEQLMLNSIAKMVTFVVLLQEYSGVHHQGQTGDGQEDTYHYL